MFHTNNAFSDNMFSQGNACLCALTASASQIRSFVNAATFEVPTPGRRLMRKSGHCGHLPHICVSVALLIACPAVWENSAIPPIDCANVDLPMQLYLNNTIDRYQALTRHAQTHHGLRPTAPAFGRG